MIQLGKIQTLKVLRNTSIGAYLGEEREVTDAFSRKNTTNNASLEQTEILLPKNQIITPLEIGSNLSVFIYKDSEDRPIATLIKPALELGKIAALKVKEITNIGAFLDWNLPKDLLLPFREQTSKVKEKDTVLVALYIDKSQRLCATMKLYHYLITNSPYQKNDSIQGHVYELSESYGAFVAIDSIYSGLIPKKELHVPLMVGENILGRVMQVLEDGKLTLSLREVSYVQIEKDSAWILSKLQEAGGFLPFHDKSDPEIIKTNFQLSKNAFKRAIGYLMKEGKLVILENGIQKTEKKG